jgi:hypothetical protein
MAASDRPLLTTLIPQPLVAAISQELFADKTNSTAITLVPVRFLSTTDGEIWDIAFVIL